MANHGYVKTRKPMTVEAVHSLVVNLIDSHFKDHVRLVRENNCFVLYYSGPEFDYIKQDNLIRIFWLESPTEFEMRHGGGGNWHWWIDSVILNEIAVEFDGIITDDGIDGSIEHEPNKWPEFKDYNQDMAKHVQGELKKTFVMQMGQELAPEAFRADLGPKIELRFSEG